MERIAHNGTARPAAPAWGTVQRDPGAAQRRHGGDRHQVRDGAGAGQGPTMEATAGLDPLESSLSRAARAGLITAGALEQLIVRMGGGARPSAIGMYVNERV